MKKYILSFLPFFFSTLCFSAEIVIQAGDNNTASTGSWAYASAATLGYEGNLGMYAVVDNSVDTYTFTATIPENNTYTMEVWNSCYSPRSHNVLHVVDYPGGSSSFDLDQDCATDPYVGQWRTLGAYSFIEGDAVSLTISDEGSNNSYIGATAMRLTYDQISTPDPEPEPEPPTEVTVVSFDCEMTMIHDLTGFNVEANYNVGSKCGRYVAEITDNNNNKTLFYHGHQGRIDGLVVSYPFEAILYNVGISPPGQPDQAYTTTDNAFMFAGLHIHHPDFNVVNSMHLVVGQRGGERNTVEAKQTVNGQSEVDSLGDGALPSGRADLRLTMDENKNVLAFWRPAGDSDWIAYGELPGVAPSYGDNGSVIVGIITYAYNQAGIPFDGVADSFEVTQ